jgi:hypothetical protein
MSDIFISYAREDRDRVELLASALAAEGWSVWWDRELPFGGRPFGQVIEEALEAARCVIVVWSSSSLASSWVLDEAAHARDGGKLLPIRIEPVKPPLGFRQFHLADLVGWDGDGEHPEYQACLARLRTLLGRPGAAGQHPPPDSTATSAPSPPPGRGRLSSHLASVRLDHVISLSLKLYLLFFVVGLVMGLLLALPSLLLRPQGATTTEHIVANVNALIVIAIAVRLLLLPFIMKRYKDVQPAEIILAMLAFFLIDILIAGSLSILAPGAYDTLVAQRKLAYWGQGFLANAVLFGVWLAVTCLRGQGRERPS